MNKGISSGHYTAIITVLIWGTTFISTKVLLESFLPIEILFLRFVLGYVALFIINPHPFSWKGLKEEITFALAGISGICLYYLLENVALTFTSASNVGVIVSTAPFFTAVLGKATGSKERITAKFYIGFLLALAGILLISLNGNEVSINPKGDLLALLAAFIWAIYSLLSKKIGAYGYNIIQATRRIFLYGIAAMLPILLLSGAALDAERFHSADNILNLLYLGLGASALCFVTWNYTVAKLGAVKTSIYIFLVPVITLIFSTIFLSEPISAMMLSGTALVLIGSAISKRQ